MKRITIIMLCVLVCMILASVCYNDFVFGYLRSETFYSMLVFSISLCLLIWDILFKNRCRKEEREAILCGHDFPDSLTTYNGIGSTMMGNFSYANGLTVSYNVYVFLGFLVWIKGCYFCKKDGASYTFYAKINGKTLEKVYLISLVPTIWVSVISLFAVFVNLYP